MNEQAIRELIQEEVSKTQKVERITMTVEEAAQYLGITEMTIYTMVREKQIPHSRLRNKIVFRKRTLDLWLDEQESANWKDGPAAMDRRALGK